MGIFSKLVAHYCVNKVSWLVPAPDTDMGEGLDNMGEVYPTGEGYKKCVETLIL